MPLKLFNTMTRQKETFKPIKDMKVGLYTCGPTVYDYPHIGNMRAYVWEDLLKRVLIVNKFKVKHVMNITDVGHLTSDEDTGEDKMEVGAKREHKSAWEIADYYTKVFFEHSKMLNIIKPDVVPKATDHIMEQAELIRKLQKKKYTYTIADGIYFDTSKLKDYGKLAKLDIEGLKAGARVEMAEGKKNPTDFALWKFSPRGQKRQMEWEMPFGKGFPGWHIECSAMSMKYLGETFDIHAGGVDHIPVHHTNEIAQSEAATGKLFVKYWLHCAHMIVDGQKMSKSLGNYYTVSDIVKKGYNPMAIRYLYINSHYRDQLNFTFQSLDAAQRTLEGIHNFIRRLYEVDGKKSNAEAKTLISTMKKDFKAAINNDLNTPSAMAVFFDFVTSMNKLMDKKGIGKKDAENVIKAIKEIDEVLGLTLKDVEKEEELSKEISELIKRREGLRKVGDFAGADIVRKKLLEEFKIVVEDTNKGVRWKKVN